MDAWIGFEQSWWIFGRVNRPFWTSGVEPSNQMPMQRFIGVVYVGSVAVGAAGGAICSVAYDGASALNMGGDYGERLIATAQDANGKNVGESILNRMMSLDQRRLLVQYFDTGELPEGLTEGSCRFTRRSLNGPSQREEMKVSIFRKPGLR